eukprot:TRINITY_DN19628_c0_g1_i1.p1 TRINITY_DN19628_c0_g1~~TRINITY_DN19628_c0_g1_i1.p1  ORF type:complete len:118 (-),score=42.83 TRINITY_DN19628_c0_g1_i1:9-332(-)
MCIRDSYFITNPKLGKVELENPKILLVDKKITNIQSILHFLEHCMTTNQALLIVCEDIDSEPITTLVVNKLRGGLRVCAVKAPSYGCLLYTSPSPRDQRGSRMPSSA